jgi:hypothetical protein
MGEKNVAPTGIRSPCHPAHREPLYLVLKVAVQLSALLRIRGPDAGHTDPAVDCILGGFLQKFPSARQITDTISR